MAAAASGQALPTLELTLAYVAACGGPPRAWRERWHESAARLRAAGANATDWSAAGQLPERRVAVRPAVRPAARRTERRPRRSPPIAVLAVAVGAAIAVIRLAERRRSGPPRRRPATPGATVAAIPAQRTPSAPRRAWVTPALLDPAELDRPPR